jgi:hypothetical protein
LTWKGKKDKLCFWKHKILRQLGYYLPTLAIQAGNPTIWIPAFAGMTLDGFLKVFAHFRVESIGT